MKQELRFNGYTAQPSDYECQDGDLAAVLNLMPEKGALHPVNSPISLGNFPGADVLYVHETTGGRKYILYDRSLEHLKWTINSAATPSSLTEAHTGRPLHISSIGNTLVIIMENEMRYYLWMADSFTYLDLGSQMPEVAISFGLQGEVIEKQEYEIGWITLNEAQQSYIGDIAEANVEQITSAVLAKVNKFIADEGTNAGKFVMPFFVRYAYRLYDGSTLTRQSAPILMVAASNTTPVACVSDSHYENGVYTELAFKVIGVTHKLDYAVKSQTQINDLKKWKDIIRSVDIFVSAPLYKYDQSGKCKSIESFNEENDWYCVCKHSAQLSTIDQTRCPLRYQKNTLYRLRENQYADGIHHTTYNRVVSLPHFSDDAYNEKVNGCSTFYLLKSISLDELSTSRTILEVAEDYLQSLVNRDVLPDDYDSHDKLVPEYAFTYNSRLNITNLSKELFRGFEPLCAFNYTDGYAYDKADAAGPNPLEHDVPESLRCFVYINQDGREIVVESVIGSIAEYAPLLYFYYPNPKAYKALFVRNGVKYEVSLTVHPFLNGAVFFSGWDGPQETSSATIPTASDSRKIEIRNKIYTSEVNNPFYFPLLGINTIGTGRIIGIATAAKALSEGQFGQFPLYAFTTDGVWAMEVSAQTGAFSARQPITRDVCINPDSITQIDSAVLFATDRGIMLISGSESICISEVMDNNEDPFDFTSMPLAASIQTILGTTGSDVFPEQPFTRDFLSGCQMLYAYNRQYIIVFNKDFDYAYIYSLESKKWGMMISNIVSRVVSYPEALAMTSESDRLVDFSQDAYMYQSDDVVVELPQFLITRPIKLDPSLKDVHKTIDTIIVRGHFAKGHVKTVLYGSRDLLNWFPVASSVDHYLRGFRGTPYKYFRIALICTLTHDESIWGCTIQYTPRLINQPR